ncbi:sulfatase-like hydrolase/transferase [Cupriavidus neocaledonicus]|uniref:Twin-arginine translocation pathway signal n=1 Tax=Cupriavidus neocaledonicus TaxID=1040979 RepID=A0A375HR46_9BURK|nr:sulfatase-like hydrolase/transferase [Cupriavidus neocaledonicus]SOZ39100.1 Twin-arginine translocation pathway signal [Cupriavidus neocaledonicus]SPD59230.1 Twin-arginine translocation pathway signal [Cupriavidus neocaledonicus]
MNEAQPGNPLSRRDFLRVAGSGALALGVGTGNSPSFAAAAPGASPQTPGQAGAGTGAYNILLILVDQERFFGPGELPAGFELPAHQRLMQRGTTFVNHRINSCVCTPSRSVLYTGQHIQQTRMFDNTNFPWIGSMSTDIPTLGHRLRQAGYYTAYKGKWHLTKEFETVNKLGTPTRIFTAEMEAYGFSDYVGIGDIIAHTRGGYAHDGVIAAMSTSWLRSQGRDLSAQGKPWFLAVNLVNPHDVMFYDTDPPGDPVQSRRGITHVARDPLDPLYARQWKFSLPASHAQALDEPGRPRAHRDFLRSHDALVGEIPNEVGRWRRRHNYYLNCMRDVDRNIAAVLQELDAAGLTEKTIVVLTSDHGDMDGAHQLHAKGAVSYREQNNVPLIIAHPRYRGGGTCRAVTSHLDIATTLLAMTGVSAGQRGTLASGLQGKDLSGLLAAPGSAGVSAVRDGALFCYNMLAYLDGDFLHKAAAFVQQGGKPDQIRSAGIRPDLMKRGAVRAVYDGRYNFARYFSPKQHNRPTTLEELVRFNDLELYDLKADPFEMVNLATGAQHRELVLAMNEKLNRLIDTEVGEDRGQMLPGGIDAGWEVSAETMAGA